MTKPISENLKVFLSVDCVIFGLDEDTLKVLLIKRGEDPFKGKWALPGDLVSPDEDLDASVVRVLEDLTGLKNVYMEQVHTFGKVDRHPIGRVVTASYFSLIKISDYNSPAASSWAKDVKWLPIKRATNLAFDHNEILNTCKNELKKNIRIKPIGFELLPKRFTLTQLQTLYEEILDVALDKRNFRKKILAMGLLVDLEELQADVSHRPAKLYSFDEKKYNQLKSKGFSFEV